MGERGLSVRERWNRSAPLPTHSKEVRPPCVLKTLTWKGRFQKVKRQQGYTLLIKAAYSTSLLGSGQYGEVRWSVQRCALSMWSLSARYLLMLAFLTRSHNRSKIRRCSADCNPHVNYFGNFLMVLSWGGAAITASVKLFGLYLNWQGPMRGTVLRFVWSTVGKWIVLVRPKTVRFFKTFNFLYSWLI